MKLDLSSLAAVRAFVAEFKASKLGLDSLILNAGVMHNVSRFFGATALAYHAYFQLHRTILYFLSVPVARLVQVVNKYICCPLPSAQLSLDFGG